LNRAVDINSKPFSGKQNTPFGRIERTIARRYLGARKKDGGVAVIALISFICITLAVSSMIIIMSIMNGFRTELIRLTIGSEGHMYVVMSTANPPPQAVIALQQQLSGIEGVDKAFEFTEDFTGVQASGQLNIGRVIGLSKQDILNFPLIADNIQFGSLQGYGSGNGEAHQIAMGSRLAASLGLTVGDRARLLTARTQANPFGPPKPVYKTYTIGAIFEVGLAPTDEVYIYMDINQSTLLFKDGKRPGNIQIRLYDPDTVELMRERVQSSIAQSVFIQTWKDRNASTAQALRTEQIAMRLIFMIVVIIATFPVLAAMIMLVKNKSKDIAILRTIGATRGSVLRIFFMAGATIGLLGTLFGLILGVLFCLNIDGIQRVLETITGVELFPADVYYLSTGIPVKIVWTEIFGVAFWGFLISSIATFFPALNASRIDPVEALRYE